MSSSPLKKADHPYFYLDKEGVLKCDEGGFFGRLVRVFHTAFSHRTYDVSQIVDAIKDKTNFTPCEKKFLLHIQSKKLSPKHLGAASTISNLVLRVVQKNERVKKEVSSSSAELLRSFDVFDIEHMSPFVNLQAVIKQIRAAGRRRPPGDEKGDLEQIQQEARFIGVTEVSYKKYLCKKDPALLLRKDSQSTTWQEQIADEESIAKDLKMAYEDKLIDIDLLIQRALKHPPLATPLYLAQLVYLYRKFPENKELLMVIQKVPYGVNSRRLHLLYDEAFSMLSKKDSALFDVEMLRKLAYFKYKSFCENMNITSIIRRLDKVR